MVLTEVVVYLQPTPKPVRLLWGGGGGGGNNGLMPPLEPFVSALLFNFPGRWTEARVQCGHNLDGSAMGIFDQNVDPVWPTKIEMLDFSSSSSCLLLEGKAQCGFVPQSARTAA